MSTTWRAAAEGETMNKLPEEILAWPREEGRIGIRNHLVVIATVFCAEHVTRVIAREIPGAVPVTHNAGCGQLGEEAEQTLRILESTGYHPNVGAALYVGLGCEQNSAHDLAAEASAIGRPAEALVIQEAGGTLAAIATGKDACARLRERMAGESDRVPVPLSKLVVGLECGGSDFTSGLVSNPAVGLACDRLVDAGASVIFGETAEALGAEHILSQRAESETVRRFILDAVARAEQAAREMKVDMRGSQPSPGNMAGGLSTIEEKSLGAICKSGSRPIVDGLAYGCRVRKSGLSFMDCPGQDLASICGLISGGAHLVLFTTGRGTPLGFATAPVIKISANSEAACMMKENIDIDLSRVLTGEKSLAGAGEEIFDRVVRVAGGDPANAEVLGHREFGFHSIGPTL